MLKKLKSIFKTNWLATFRLNRNAGGWKAVLRMPIKVYGPLKLTLAGKIILPPDAERGTVVINSVHEDYTALTGKSELNISGVCKFGGFLRIGGDSCIIVGKDALLEIGSDTYLGRDTQIHCYKHVSIGNGVFAGETYISDSSFHPIYNKGIEKPMEGEVLIGDGVYMGFRTTLLKGTVIPQGSVVGSGAVCTSDYSQHGAAQLLICGNPAVVTAHSVTARF